MQRHDPEGLAAQVAAMLGNDATAMLEAMYKTKNRPDGLIGALLGAYEQHERNFDRLSASVRALQENNTKLPPKYVRLLQRLYPTEWIGALITALENHQWSTDKMSSAINNAVAASKAKRSAAASRAAPRTKAKRAQTRT